MANKTTYKLTIYNFYYSLSRQETVEAQSLKSACVLAVRQALGLPMTRHDGRDIKAQESDGGYGSHKVTVPGDSTVYDVGETIQISK